MPIDPDVLNLSPSRRRFLLAACGVLAAGAVGRSPFALAQGTTEPSTRPTINRDQRYRISACDWMLLKRQKLGAMKLGRDCGLDGVEVDLGSLGDRPDIVNALRDEKQQQAYLDASDTLGVDISSLALSAFYGQAFADHPRAEVYVEEMIGLLPKMRASVGFLPLGTKTDTTDPEIRKKVIERFKRLAPIAEKAKVTIAIQANITSDDYRKLLDDIGSPAVKVYYSTGAALEAKRDPYAELKTLAKEYLSQIHLTGPDGVWLQDGLLDVKQIKGVLDDAGWKGWLVLERSRVKDKTVKENYSANAAYLKSIFQAA